MKATQLLLVLSLVLFGCGSNPAKPLRPLRSDAITIIVDKAPVNKWYISETGSKSGIAPPCEMQWINDNLLTGEYSPPDYPASDTFSISTERSVLEVVHRYKGIQLFHYLFHRGDSVVFTYPDSVPYAQILNRKINDAELNYDYYKIKKTRDEFPAITKASMPFIFSMDKNFGVKQLTEAVREMPDETKNLDSLHNAGIISDEGYTYIQTNLNAQLTLTMSALYEIAPLQMAIFGEASGPFSLGYSNYIERYGGDDSLAYFFYNKAVIATYNQHRLKQFGKKKFRPGYLGFDELVAYDSLRKETQVKGKSRKLMLYDKFIQLLPLATAKEKVEYFRKFQEDVPDTALVNAIAAKFHIESTLNQELLLDSISGRTTTFTQVLAANNGKTIYVDIWASWCAPCIQELPTSLKLKNDPAYKNISFIYLSWDDNPVSWKKGVTSTGQTSEDTYRMTNGHSSKFLDDIELTSIPRYLVFDTAGRLVNKYAARPTVIKSVGDIR